MSETPRTMHPDTTQLDLTPEDEPVVEDDWLAAPERRSRLRTVLMLLLGASLVFFAGAQVQRHYGSTSRSSAASAVSPLGGGGALPSGFPGGGAAPGGAGSSGGAGLALPGAGSSGGEQPEGGSTATSTTSLIGTVLSVRGNRWTVKDLGGKTHVVHVPTDARVVRETSVPANKVAQGATVDISGSTSGGSLNASTITVR